MFDMNKDNLNVFVVPCQMYEKKSNSIIGIYNNVEIENKEMDLCVFTGINYVGTGNQMEFKFDYFLKCLVDEDGSEQDGKKIPLFAISANRKLDLPKQDEHKTFETVFSQESKIPIPCSGLYELQLYMIDDEAELGESPNERYKKYQERKILPKSAFRFHIVNKDH